MLIFLNKMFKDKQFLLNPAYTVLSNEKEMVQNAGKTCTVVRNRFGRFGLLRVVGTVGVKPYLQRLAELYTISKRRKLTDAEGMEMSQCLAANAKDCWEQAYLENISLMASMTNDVDWQHEICAEIDQNKKPGRKGTD